MSVNEVNKQTGDTSRIAGGTLYADAPIGAILAFGGATAPAGWLLCQGQAISRTTYAALFAVIGTAYGAGDGSTTFNLPDPREAALVGAGTNVLNAGSIAAHNAVSLGAFQDDQMQKMEGNIGEVFNFTTPSGVFKLGSASPTGFVGDGQYNPYDVQMDTSEAARTGTTTHGKQLGVNYIIKAQQVALPADFEAAVFKEPSLLYEGTFTTVRGTVTLSDSIENYREIIIEAGFTPESDNFFGFTTVPVILIKNNYADATHTHLIDVLSGTLDRWIRVQFQDATTLELWAGKVEGSDCLRRVYGIK